MQLKDARRHATRRFIAQLSARLAETDPSGVKPVVRIRMSKAERRLIGCRPAKYVVAYNREAHQFGVINRKRDGRFNLLDAERTATSAEHTVELYAVIIKMYRRPMDPIVKVAKDVPSVCKLRCRALYEGALSQMLPSELDGLDWDHFRVTHEHDGYRPWYLNPMRALLELGLVRFGPTSWRLR